MNPELVMAVFKLASVTPSLTPDTITVVKPADQGLGGDTRMFLASIAACCLSTGSWDRTTCTQDGAFGADDGDVGFAAGVRELGPTLVPVLADRFAVAVLADLLVVAAFAGAAAAAILGTEMFAVGAGAEDVEAAASAVFRAAFRAAWRARLARAREDFV